MNAEYKNKIAQMGSLMRFLVFPSSGQEEMPREGLQYFSTSVSVIQFPNEYRFSVSLCPTPFLPVKKETLGAERSGVPPGLDWGVTELPYGEGTREEGKGGGVKGGERKGGGKTSSEGSEVFICCVFMTFYKSHEERWKRPWTGCPETSCPV